LRKPLLLVAALCLAGCSDKNEKLRQKESQTKLIYFGFDNHSETQADVLNLAGVWAQESTICKHWRGTMSEKEADYRVLFGDTTVTIVGRRGEILYAGGQGPLYLPHGNPDGSGINVCKLTGG
jgi:hypothetical protein